LSDELTDSTHTVASRRIINAAGPWADRLPHSAVKLRLTKGIHLVDQRSLPVPDAVVMTQGKRILFAIPWGDRVILGTTDTDYDGSLDDIRADAADVDYVLGVANEFFPRAGLRTGDVISTWAGVRPLIAQPGGKPSDISRAHQILNPEPGWLDIAGGKLTTYRLMAEQAVDRVVESLRRSGALNCEIASCRTATEPLLPASETDAISGIISPELSRELVEHFCADEWATSMVAVMLRRKGWFHYHRDVMDWRREIAEWMAAIHGWTSERQNTELSAFEALVLASRPGVISRVL
jgi:glycerol-3-phosphate dehydrogenase